MHSKYRYFFSEVPEHLPISLFLCFPLCILMLCYSYECVFSSYSHHLWMRKCTISLFIAYTVPSTPCHTPTHGHTHPYQTLWYSWCQQLVCILGCVFVCCRCWGVGMEKGGKGVCWQTIWLETEQQQQPGLGDQCWCQTNIGLVV